MSPPLALDHAGLAEHAQVVRDGRLADVAAAREVAGADLLGAGQLADDRQAGRVGEGREEADVGVDEGGAGSMPHHIDERLY